MPEARFRHIDQEKWQEVRAQQHGDRRCSVREKWLEFTPSCMTLYAEWDPGMIVHKHGHNSDHIIFVLEGSMLCGDFECTPGQHIFLEQGEALGPYVAGPDGVKLFEVMMGDPRSWPADPEGFAKLLDQRGAVQLPNPPIDMPDWIEDTRSEH